MSWTIHNQDVLEWCKTYTGPKFHAILCDPPYHLYSPVSRSGSRTTDDVSEAKFNRFVGSGFMNAQWDGGDIAFRPETWSALKEHMLPGAFGFAFASSRGWHRMACAIEDAGFVFHPTVFFMAGWLYGSGFPKASRVRDGNQEDSDESETLSDIRSGSMHAGRDTSKEYIRPKIRDNSPFAGHRYGLQALKPAMEPIICFQKPYEGKPIEVITATGAGALNIDGSRIVGAAGSGVWGTSNETCAPTFNGSPTKHEFRSKAVVVTDGKTQPESGSDDRWCSCDDKDEAHA